jgi:hypothetical protein
MGSVFVFEMNVALTRTVDALPFAGTNRTATRTVIRCLRRSVLRERSDNFTVTRYVLAAVTDFDARSMPEPETPILPFPGTFTVSRVDVPRTSRTFATRTDEKAAVGLADELSRTFPVPVSVSVPAAATDGGAAATP